MKTKNNCKECGSTFESYNPKPTYCSFNCRIESQKHKVKLEQIIELYELGNSQTEIAKYLNTSQKVIYTRLKQAKYKCRVNTLGKIPTGEHSPHWKGADALYKALHLRVTKAFGQPKECKVCGTTNPTKTYEWANLTGKLDDLTDYKRMCRSCHSIYDQMEKNFKQKGGDAK